MIAVDRRIISFLIIVAELNQDVIGFELDEFIQSLRQSLKGGAILRVVDDLCATIKRSANAGPQPDCSATVESPMRPMVTVPFPS